MSSAEPPFSPEFFEREDESNDALFYTEPRLLVHIDEQAIAAVSQLFLDLISPDSVVLDLMSSWRSHWPQDHPKERMVGLGLNAAEMQANPDLDDYVIHNVNEEPVLPFEDESFDAAVSTQVYEYVPDISKALAELYRVLRPGGRAVIVDTDYGSLVMHTENPGRMDRVLAAWDEHFVYGDLPRTLSPQLRDAGFTLRERAVIPMFNPEYDSNTYSHGMIEIIASFVAGRSGVTREEADAWAAEFAELGKQGKYFFSLNRYLFVAGKPDAAGGA